MSAEEPTPDPLGEPWPTAPLQHRRVDQQPGVFNAHITESPILWDGFAESHDHFWREVAGLAAIPPSLLVSEGQPRSGIAIQRQMEADARARADEEFYMGPTRPPRGRRRPGRPMRVHRFDLRGRDAYALDHILRLDPRGLLDPNADPEDLATFQRCTTLVRDLREGLRCGCGRTVAVDDDDYGQSLAFHEVGADLWPRFLVLDAVGREDASRHTTTFTMRVLDRAAAQIVISEVEITQPILAIAIRNGAVSAHLIRGLARRVEMSEGDVERELDRRELIPAPWMRRTIRSIRFLYGMHYSRHTAEEPVGLAPTDRGRPDAVPLSSDTEHELTPDVAPPKPEAWAALNAKIDAAAPPRKSAIDMITRCAGNSDGA